MDIDDYHSFDWELSYLPGVSGSAAQMAAVHDAAEFRHRSRIHEILPRNGGHASQINAYQRRYLIPIVGSGRSSY